MVQEAQNSLYRLIIFRKSLLFTTLLKNLTDFLNSNTFMQGGLLVGDDIETGGSMGSDY